MSAESNFEQDAFSQSKTIFSQISTTKIYLH